MFDALLRFEAGLGRGIQVDLRDPASIDKALEEVGGPVDALFSAAGIADGPDLMKINFIGHRHVIDKLISNGQLGRGGAICFISSVAGIGWETDLPGFRSSWPRRLRIGRRLEQSPRGRTTSATTAPASRRSTHMSRRMHSRSWPRAFGSTRSARARPTLRSHEANADLWLSFAQDYREATGSATHTPEQMGNVMAFLNSDAAAGVNGVTLLVDYGHVSSSNTGTRSRRASRSSTCSWAASRLDSRRGRLLPRTRAG